MPTNDAPVTVREVALTVRDLAAVAAFYERIVGLGRIGGDAAECVLGAGGQPLLRLAADRHAPVRTPREAGLFHTAFLLPAREHLADWVRFAGDEGVRLEGASDHGVSEAIYLSDPEGNGIEIYCDRPRDAWQKAHGEVLMGTDRLDMAGLLAAATGAWRGVPDSTTIGHVHLRAGDVALAGPFWTGLGFAVTSRREGAHFFGSGGYHHHVAANTWHSRGAPPLGGPGTGLAGLTLAAEADAFAAIAAGREEVVTLHDPWNIPVEVRRA